MKLEFLFLRNNNLLNYNFGWFIWCSITCSCESISSSACWSIDDEEAVAADISWHRFGFIRLFKRDV